MFVFDNTMLEICMIDFFWIVMQMTWKHLWFARVIKWLDEDYGVLLLVKNNGLLSSVCELVLVNYHHQVLCLLS